MIKLKDLRKLTDAKLQEKELKLNKMLIEWLKIKNNGEETDILCNSLDKIRKVMKEKSIL